MSRICVHHVAIFTIRRCPRQVLASWKVCRGDAIRMLVSSHVLPTVLGKHRVVSKFPMPLLPIRQAAGVSMVAWILHTSCSYLLSVGFHGYGAQCPGTQMVVAVTCKGTHNKV